MLDLNPLVLCYNTMTMTMTFDTYRILLNLSTTGKALSVDFLQDRIILYRLKVRQKLVDNSIFFARARCLAQSVNLLKSKCLQFAHNAEIPHDDGKSGQAATHVRRDQEKLASSWSLDASCENMVSGTHFGLAYLLLDMIHATVDLPVAQYGTHQGRQVRNSG